MLPFQTLTVASSSLVRHTVLDTGPAMMFDKRRVRTRGAKSTRHIPCAICSPSVTRPPAERGDVLRVYKSAHGRDWLHG